MTRSRFALLAVPLALALASCGDDTATTATTAAPTVTPTTVAASDSTGGTEGDDETTVPSSATDPPATGDTTVALAESALGTILVDGAGRTLYLFTADTGPVSTCTGGCASNWPAFGVTGEPTVGDGLDDSSFTVITGADGKPQLAFNDHPLYYFAGDTAAGDTNGQGVGGVWFVVDADGNAIGA
ncbi:MAG: hypothetical protein Q7V88_19165 [Actinomycetota bacterium]|nr:hypothetical protein [Actinomycetota bacterium]